MSALEDVRNLIPEIARDLKLNLQTVLQPSTLSEAQRWGVAVACAAAARNAGLREAVIADARALVAPAVVEDALAAAALMGMNNVYYRFRHLIEKPSYGEKPARLRMNRLVKPAGSKVDFELFSLAVSAVNGCGACMIAHEKVVIEGGLTEDQVHDAVRIAAVIAGAAVALDLVGDDVGPAAVAAS
ncbi:MAG TPA: carboxymuconolactone decarboxylase family protein [Polyangia bacterium]|jgi:alkyl hydroperoxide reductase subunit D|nr:carboxymuconolactone decarboxylase family protein [Polyangia bacterium]